MHRRDFLLGGIKVSLSFLVLDALAVPAFGQRSGGAAHGHLPLRPGNLTRPPDNLDDSLNVLAAYLARYAPPLGQFTAAKAWKARYDLLEWVGSPTMDGAAFSRSNRVLGHMEVTRRPGSAGAGASYELDHALTLNGFETTLQATMQCAAGSLPGLQDWTTNYAMRPSKSRAPALTLSEQGRHRDGLLEITSAAGVRRFETDRPVLPQWAVLDALGAARGRPGDFTGEGEFDLFHDLTSYRPLQRLRPCGVLEISLDGRAHTLRGFVQTGWGTEPTHYWIDAAGRPLLVTGGLFSSALTALGPA
jgi:hypothetical protein